ncbi:MAG: DUF123 domain-containing protein [Halodesulfurarchaeum sp.]
MNPGTYTILLELEEERTVTFGAAGSRELAPGFYAYTGSAFGPGGLSRVDRHRRVLRGRNSTRHWHVDYLLDNSAVTWIGTWVSPHRRNECEIAGALLGDPLPGIGSSDCSCESHLVFHTDRSTLTTAIEAVHEKRYSSVSHSEGD